MKSSGANRGDINVFLSFEFRSLMAIRNNYKSRKKNTVPMVPRCELKMQLKLDVALLRRSPYPVTNVLWLWLFLYEKRRSKCDFFGNGFHVEGNSCFLIVDFIFGVLFLCCQTLTDSPN